VHPAPILRRAVFAAFAAFASLLATLPAAADLAAWDQNRVAGIAKNLAAACDAFREAVRHQPGVADVGSGNAQNGLELGQSAGALRERSMALSGHLAKGKGYDQTRNEWSGLREIADDVEEHAQRSPLDDPTMAAWAKVADLMRQLAPYYDAKASAP
jgi:hypothetical protein